MHLPLPRPESYFDVLQYEQKPSGCQQSGSLKIDISAEKVNDP